MDSLSPLFLKRIKGEIAVCWGSVNEKREPSAFFAVRSVYSNFAFFQKWFVDDIRLTTVITDTPHQCKTHFLWKMQFFHCFACLLLKSCKRHPSVIQNSTLPLIGIPWPWQLSRTGHVYPRWIASLLPGLGFCSFTVTLFSIVKVLFSEIFKSNNLLNSIYKVSPSQLLYGFFFIL